MRAALGNIGSRPHKNEKGPILFSTDRANEVSKKFIIWRLLYKLVYLEFSGFSELKDTAHDRFHGNGPDGQIPTKKEPIRTLGFTSRLPRHIINTSYLQIVMAAGPYL